VPRVDRAPDLSAASCAHEVLDGHHQVDGGCALDRRGEWRFVLLTLWPELHDRAIEQPPDAFDDVAVGHAHAHYGKPGVGWRPGEERSLALEDPGEPMEVRRVDDYDLRIT